MPARRRLSFADLADVSPDVGRLLAGHRTIGRWSLGQICNHLSTSIHYTLDGFPGRGLPRALQETAGRIPRTVVFGTGRIMGGVPLPRGFAPPAASDAHEEAAVLRAVIERFLAWNGPLDTPHPYLGRFTRKQWDHYHRIHCAHHLSFAHPTADADERQSAAP